MFLTLSVSLSVAHFDSHHIFSPNNNESVLEMHVWNSLKYAYMCNTYQQYWIYLGIPTMTLKNMKLQCTVLTPTAEFFLLSNYTFAVTIVGNVG